MAKWVYEVEKAILMWTLLALVRQWVRSPSRVLYTRTNFEAQSQRLALKASWMQKRSCRWKSPLLVKSQALMMRSNWKLTSPSSRPLRPMTTLVKSYPLVTSAVKSTSSSWLVQTFTRLRGSHTHCSRSWMSMKEKQSRFPSNCCGADRTKCVRLVSLFSQL